jgi:cytoskeletal protein RodZ
MDNVETRESDLNRDAIQDVADTPVQHEGEDMAVVADLLKRAREEKGMSLKDAELATRVPSHYLQILEGGGDSRLLADVLYLIPFLRTYSVFLGLDPAETIPQFLVGVQRGEAPSNIRIPQPRRSAPRARLVLFVLAGLVVLSLLWFFGGRS